LYQESVTNLLTESVDLTCSDSGVITGGYGLVVVLGFFSIFHRRCSLFNRSSFHLQIFHFLELLLVVEIIYSGLLLINHSSSFHQLFLLLFSSFLFGESIRGCSGCAIISFVRRLLEAF